MTNTNIQHPTPSTATASENTQPNTEAMSMTDTIKELEAAKEFEQYLIEPEARLSESELRERLEKDPELLNFFKDAYKYITERVRPTKSFPQYAHLQHDPRFSDETDTPTGPNGKYENREGFWFFVTEVQMPPATYKRTNKSANGREVCEWSVDRIDGSKGYVAGNLRWASRQLQIQNSLTVRWEKVNGFQSYPTQIANSIGVPVGSLRSYKRSQLVGLKAALELEELDATLELVVYSRLHGLRFTELHAIGLVDLIDDEYRGLTACLSEDAVWTKTKAEKIPTGTRVKDFNPAEVYGQMIEEHLQKLDG